MRAHIPQPPIVEEEPIVLEDGSIRHRADDQRPYVPVAHRRFRLENEFHFCGRKPKTGLPTAKHMPEKPYQPQQLRRRRAAMVG